MFMLYPVPLFSSFRLFSIAIKVFLIRIQTPGSALAPHVLLALLPVHVTLTDGRQHGSDEDL